MKTISSLPQKKHNIVKLIYEIFGNCIVFTMEGEIRAVSPGETRRAQSRATHGACE